MPGALQMGLGPEKWGITLAQLISLRREVVGFYTFNCDDAKFKSMRQVVKDIVKPLTKGTGLGYALMLNQDKPVLAQNMISHSWDEDFLEFVDAVTVVSGAIKDEGLWICALAIYQKKSDLEGPGPSIAEQLGDDVLDGPFVVVVRQAKRMLVVQTSRAQVYSRLWCVLELFQAIQMNIDVRLLGLWTWESSRSIQPQNAICYDQSDAHKIRSAIESTCGWATLARVILKRMKHILATRDEWPLVRSWEWKILEAMRCDNAELILEAATDPDCDWTVRVGKTYGDPNDKLHIYHLVMSFGSLQWRVGQTLWEIARLNCCWKAAAAMEAFTRCIGETALSAINVESDSFPCHATRDEGPCARFWEWMILEAIRCDDSTMVHEAAEDPDVSWDVQIGESYGSFVDKSHVYYLVMSFGLKWRIGHTLKETAELNGRSQVARTIDACARAKEEQVGEAKGGAASQVSLERQQSNSLRLSAGSEGVTADRLVSVFREVDHNNSGFLTRLQLVTVLKSLPNASSCVTEGSIDTLMGILDKEGDGMIAYEKFVKWLFDS